ncbi:hypothetical protein FACS1894105_13700 [Clostridia bacterium]|nr:hypothetical protein FACS1894105_13700 [Clostridia bacterium]
MKNKTISHVIEIESGDESNIAVFGEPIRRAVTSVLAYERIKPPCEVSVTLTDDSGIRELNKIHRSKDSVTDVLSFPQIDSARFAGEMNFTDGDKNPENGAVILGDIVINLVRAKQQSEDIGQSHIREVMFLAVHSALHLLGYDHETNEQDEKIMFTKQKEIMDIIDTSKDTADDKVSVASGEKRTVFAAIVGRPNVGKSTLLNAMLGDKVSIVSKKPQTTRSRITGVLTRDNAQFVFFDTPGVHLPKSLLGQYMTKSAKGVIADVDVALLVIEPEAHVGAPERDILERAKASKIPTVLVINKVDTLSKDKILEVIANYSAEFEFVSILPISALNNDGVDLVLAEISKFLKDSEFFFPEDIITDQPDKQIASEIVREKALRLLSDEIPHGIGVSIEEFNEKKKNVISIRAEIFCEKESHKRIIIGKGGEMIKKIGTYARGDLEEYFGKSIYIDLWVKVKGDWRDKKNILQGLGYDDSDL